VETKKLKSFKELIVWQKAYKLVLEIYKFTNNFPKTETYGLGSANQKSSNINSFKYSRRIRQKTQNRLSQVYIYCLWFFAGT